MGTIARTAKAGGGTNFNAGQTIDPNEVNTDFNTAFTEINGALDDGNIESATIPGAKSLRFTEISAPSAPSSNDILMYAKDNGSGTTYVYVKDSAGTEKRLDTGDLFLSYNGAPYKDVNTTTSEVSVFASAPSIAGNTLSTNRTMRIGIIGDILANSGTPTLTVKVKYGATTALTFTSAALGTNATRNIWYADALIAAAGATGAQVSRGWAYFATSVHDVTGGSQAFAAANYFLSTHNAIAEDSTAAKTLDVTITPSASSANFSIRVHVLTVELL